MAAKWTNPDWSPKKDKRFKRLEPIESRALTEADKTRRDHQTRQNIFFRTKIRPKHPWENVRSEDLNYFRQKTLKNCEDDEKWK